MAITGAYSIAIKTPIGERKIKLSLIENGKVLTGTFTNDKCSTELMNGVVDGNKIAFDVLADTFMGQMNFHISCSINEDVVSGKAKLPMGEFPVTGSRSA